MFVHPLAQFFGHGHGDVKIGARQHLGLARLEPALGLRAVTFGTAAILAGMVGEDLGAAVVATPDAAAERLGAARQYVGDGAAMRRRHRRAMGREIVAGEATKDVRDLDHDGSAGSEAGPQPVEDASERDAGRLGEVGVDRGRGNLPVAEQNLHDPGVHAVLEQPRRIAVAQGVRCDPPRETGLARGLSKRAAQHLLADRMVAGAIGKEPARIAMDLPEPAQVLQDRLRQWREPLPVALADDAEP